MGICKKKALEKCVKVTLTTLFDQNKLVSQKRDAIMILELLMKFANVLFIIGSLRFQFKVDVQVAF